MPPLPTRDLDHVVEHARGDLLSLAGARLFITGGTGFVGSWLVESLLHADSRLGLNVAAVVLSREPERFRSAHPMLANDPRLSFLRGDAHAFEFPAGDFPFMIHAAPPPSGDDRVLEFARTRGVRRFLFTSSGAVYGPQPPDMTHISEEADLTGNKPLTLYGAAKAAGERQCVAEAGKHGFSALIARMFAFTGPRLPLDANFAAGNFVRDALAGGPIRVASDGTPSRSYLYAADLAVWLWTILVRGESGRPYNVGSGDAVTIAELAALAAELTRPPTSVVVAKKPYLGDLPQRYVPSVERAERELGLRPLIRLEDGMRRMYEWERGQPA